MPPPPTPLKPSTLEIDFLSLEVLLRTGGLHPLVISCAACLSVVLTPCSRVPVLGLEEALATSFTEAVPSEVSTLYLEPAPGSLGIKIFFGYLACVAFRGIRFSLDVV